MNMCLLSVCLFAYMCFGKFKQQLSPNFTDNVAMDCVVFAAPGTDENQMRAPWRRGQTSRRPQFLPLKTVVILCCMHDILALHGAYESKDLHAPLGVWAMGVQSVYAMLPRHGSMWTADQRNIIYDRPDSYTESGWGSEWDWEVRSAPSSQHDGRFEDGYGEWSDNESYGDNGGYGGEREGRGGWSEDDRRSRGERVQNHRYTECYDPDEDERRRRRGAQTSSADTGRRVERREHHGYAERYDPDEDERRRCRGAQSGSADSCLDMSAIEGLRGKISGKIYAVVRGLNGAGFFSEWETCGVTGCSAVYKKFEFNERSTGGKKYGSHSECEAAAIHYLLSHESTPQQIVRGLRTLVDAREAEEAQKHKRREREQAEAKAAEARRLQEGRRLYLAGCHCRDSVVDDVLRTMLPLIAAEMLQAEESEREAAAHRRAEREAASETLCNNGAAVSTVQVVLAGSPRHDRPDGQRSAGAKRKRRKAQTAKKAARQEDASSRTAATAHLITTGGAAEPFTDATAFRAELDRERARRALAEEQVVSRDKLLATQRRRLKREVKTASMRARQDERRSSKAKLRARKVSAARGIAGAARKEKERTRKRKQPAGEPLHTGERRHQQRSGPSSGSGGSRGKGGGKGQSSGSGGGRGKGGGKGQSSGSGGGRGKGKGGGPHHWA